MFIHAEVCFSYIKDFPSSSIALEKKVSKACKNCISEKETKLLQFSVLGSRRGGGKMVPLYLIVLLDGRQSSVSLAD